jgi:hypothetical protein
MNAQDRKRHHDMLKDPNAWPYWPVLPMKRSMDHSPNLGFVTADFPNIVLSQRPSMKGILLQLACEEGDGLPVVGRPEEENHHEPKDSKMYKVYEDNVIKRYDDIDGMLDDGWKID